MLSCEREKTMSQINIPAPSANDKLKFSKYASYYKDIPSTLYRVLDSMYKSACHTHNRMLNRAELKLHGIEFDLNNLLRNYQMKRRKNEVNQKLRDLAARI